MGISPLIIGLTIVALGTSSPELAVAVSSSLAGQSDLVVGNVVGSNIYNILLILGIGAVIAPLIVSQRLVRLDVPLVIGASILMLVLALDGKIGRMEGGVLFAGIHRQPDSHRRTPNRCRSSGSISFAFAGAARPPGGIGATSCPRGVRCAAMTISQIEEI